MPSPETLSQISNTLVVAAIVVYALAMLAYAAQAARRAVTQSAATASISAVAGRNSGEVGVYASSPSREPTALDRLGALGSTLTVVAFLLHLLSVVTRGWAAERAPWGNMYEFALVGALAAAGAYLVFLRREPVRDLGVWILGIILVTLGLAVTVLYTPAAELVPVLDTYWLVIHVAAAIIAGGVFTFGAVATVLYLVKARAESRATNASTTRYIEHLPSAATLDRIAHTAHLFAFPIWTFAIIAGAVWAENSWGRYWGWDPKETWAFITWVLYAAYLHAQATAGWRGRKAAWFALLGFLAFLFNFFGVNIWIPGLHSYADV